MTHKWVFLGCAAMGLLGLFFACSVLSALTIAAKVDLGTSVAGFNLLVDIVVGVFTIWGLFWAASEFGEQSVRPALNLIVGAEQDMEGQPAYNPLSGTEVELPGTRRDQEELSSGVLRVGLFLENRKPRMAERVQLVIEIESVPQVSLLQPVSGTFEYEAYPNITATKAVLRFGDDLVVYQGEGVFLGVLHLEWRRTSLPEHCRFKYSLYNAQGPSQRGQIATTIDWK